MKKVTIDGASDDIVTVNNCGVVDEYDGYDKNVIVSVVSTPTKTGARVIAKYGERYAIWSFEVEQLDEDISIPKCYIENSERGYSVRVVFEFDDNEIVTVMKR